jgi:1-acyl-sn-glycerol-3-phosphate acyltransferase
MTSQPTTHRRKEPDVSGDHHSASAASLPQRSPRLYRGFARYCRWYVRRHFDALRLARPGFPQGLGEEPLLVYLNHPSWWDPLVGLLLAELGFSNRAHYAPIDAAGLRQYAFFARLGFFGIDPHHPIGGTRFLRLGQRIMAQPPSALWVTAEGQFTDPRQRPVVLQRGVAHLAKRLDRGIILPLALEYPFWQEKRPEALACFGEPMSITDQPERSADQWQTTLSHQLEHTMDHLSTLACRKAPADWHTLLAGRTGTNGAYDLWRAMRAALRGQCFRRSHWEATRHD